MEKEIKKGVLLTEEERREQELFLEEFNQRGGMTTEEMIKRLGAIPFEDFMHQMHNKIMNYKKK